MLSGHVVVMVAAYTTLFGKDDGAMFLGLFDEYVSDGAPSIFKIDVFMFELHVDAIIAYAG